MKYLAWLLMVLLGASFLTASAAAPAQGITGSYSFENDMEGWTAKGVDVEKGSGTEPWSITRTQEIASDGVTSLKLFLLNDNDGGKVLIEKPFAVEPGQLYEARLEFDLGTADSDGIQSQIIAGVLTEPPQNGDDLVPAAKDETGTGYRPDTGYVWVKKSYDFVVLSTSDALYVVVGYWGTFEGPRLYYLDNVRVSITRKPPESLFFSFENDLEGWSPRAADLELPSGASEDWSIVRSTDKWTDGRNSVKFELNNLNQMGKLWIERPFAVDPGRKYKITVDYDFHDYFFCGRTNFRRLTGVFRSSPQTGNDAAAAVQDKTTTDPQCTWGFNHKAYNFTIKSKKSQTLYVVIGVIGVEQAHGRYNIDSVCVTITPK